MFTSDRDTWIQRAREIPIETIAPEGLKRQGRQLVGPCPRCDGTDRFAIHLDKGVFNCRGCGAKGDKIELAQLKWGCDFNTAVERLTGEPPAGKPNGRQGKPDFDHPQATFDYHDLHGNVVYQNVRLPLLNADGTPKLSSKGKPDKTFRQRRRQSRRWVYDLKGVARVPYRLPDLVAAIQADRTVPVVMPEGEAKVDLLLSWGIPATYIATPECARDHAELFTGCDVVLMPDHDDTGRNRANGIGSEIVRTAARVRVLALPALDTGGDIIDWVAAGGTPEDLLDLINDAPPWQPPAKPNGKDAAATPAALTSVAASTYQMRGIRWFWNNRFALGKLGLIGGLPDRGKGLITSYMIARATTAGAWPCNEGRASLGNVLLLTAEDDIEDTIIPRLVAAGADLDRVHIVKMVREPDKPDRMFSLVTDLPLLRQKIDDVGNVVLVVIDPMSAYLGVGKVDSYRATDVRGVLTPLTDLAAEKRLSIIGIMHFNKKADVHDAMLRIADSLAYVAASRHCYVVVDDPGYAENKRRLFVKAKNNLAPDMAALSYTVDVVSVGQDPETKAVIAAPYVVWGTEHVQVTATEALHAEKAGASQSGRPRDAAKSFLEEMLATGPVLMREIEEAAKANLISRTTLKRAKLDLGVVSKKVSADDGWTWELPKTRSAAPLD